MKNEENELEKIIDEYLNLEEKWEKEDEFVFFKKLNSIEKGLYIKAKKYSFDIYLAFKKDIFKMYKKILIIDILLFFICLLIILLIFIF